MITYGDVRLAINKKLHTLGIEIQSTGVEEGFDRPSFFVQLENSVRTGYESQVHKSLTVQIYFFPEDRYDYSIDILDMREELENLFDLKLKIDDRFIDINEVDSIITDGVLSFSFDIAFYDGREKVYTVDGQELNDELMEKLNIDFDKE